MMQDLHFALSLKHGQQTSKHYSKTYRIHQTQGYQKDAFVRQFDRQGNITRSYKFAQIWPSNVSAIDLAWDSNDTPEEYTVEFQVQYWTYVNKENMGNEKPID